jgi:membrane protease subunit HflK
MTDSTKVLVDTDGGNNMLYLPLDKLVQQGSSSQIRNNENTNELIDRVANEVIEKLQRSSNQIQSERRR